MLVDCDYPQVPALTLTNSSINVVSSQLVENVMLSNGDRRLWVITLNYPIGLTPAVPVSLKTTLDPTIATWEFPSYDCPNPNTLVYKVTPLEYLQDGLTTRFEIRMIPFYPIDPPVLCNTPYVTMTICTTLLNLKQDGYIVALTTLYQSNLSGYTSTFNLTFGATSVFSILIPIEPRYKEATDEMVISGSDTQSPISTYAFKLAQGYFVPVGAMFDMKTSNPDQTFLLSSANLPIIAVQGNNRDGLRYLYTRPASELASGSQIVAGSYLVNSNSSSTFPLLDQSSITINLLPLPTKPILARMDFILADNIFSQVVTIFQCSYPLRFRTGNSASVLYFIPAPFGYTVTGNGQTKEFTFSFNGIVSLNLQMTIYQQSTTQQDSVVSTRPNPIPGSVITDTILPTLSNIQLLKVSTTSYIVTLQLGDTLSGVDSFQYNNILYFGSNTIVGGTINDGTFVFEHTPSFADINSLDLIVVDRASNYLYSQYKTFGLYGQSIPPNPIRDSFVTADNFTMFEFIPNIVDTSKGPVNVSLVFNLTGSPFNRYNNLDLVVMLSPWSPTMPSIYRSLNISSKSYYHPLDQLFRCDFTVPQYTNNITSAYYNFDYYSVLLSSIQPSLVAKFGSNATLTIRSNNSMDHLPPYFESMVLPTTLVDGKLVYEFTIVDYLNGFDNGSVEIKSDGSPLTQVLRFDRSSPAFIGGNIFKSNWRFEIPINVSECLTQTYSIGKTELYDTGGWAARYMSFNFNSFTSGTYFTKTDSYFNPYYYVLDQLTNVTITCDPTTDVDSPSIVSFEVSRSTMDVGSNDRTVSFNLSVTDGTSGIGLEGYPIVYLMGNQGEWLAVEPFVKTPPAVGSLVAVFNYTVTVPHGFGVNGIILLSVYGLRDKVQNLGGYSTPMLNQAGFQYKISTTYSTNIPTLFSVSNLYSYPSNLSSSDDTYITIRGRGFGDDTQQLAVTVQQSGGSQRPLVVSMAYHIILFVKYDPATIAPGSNVSIVVTRSGSVNQQDTISVNPTILPPRIPDKNTPVPFEPKPTPCSPSSSSSALNCTGNGQCTFDGCICNNGWSGFFCESTVINIDEPTFNQISPTVDIIVNGTSNHTVIKSIISVVAIRELTIDDTVFIEYRPKNWTLNITTTDNNNSIVMNYQTRLQDISTIVNVTIEWFSKDSQVVFANQSISIPATSTKVSIGLSAYPFYSSTNTLQVVMKTSIQAEYESECSSKEYGGTTEDMEWMKLGIDDKTLWGQFIKRGIIDGDRITSITNEILSDYIDDSTSNSTSNSNSSSSTTFIGLNLPQYSVSAQLDPNFVHLIDVDNGDKTGSTLESICKSKDNGLTMGQIAGIVVGCIAAGAIAIASAIYLVHRRRTLKSNLKMQQKLSKLKTPNN
ncbi:putative transmembrane protein [Cavenderia fasciculata]|uniref:Transmembrane protein n=1 Tax=Cavenderia fasciculata TaxID=261658 RepID=F4Q256_CACFS|nr:putative transmembrane protein [Cavenderia fasciculata]EGG18076.1 putative transmembrane protein [Cavenderia fasciculata]|eukprot:XP_004366117.1 putative transmembrane protein [Cavenderia fasciculata]